MPLGLSFEGFCWYPFIDSTDWCSLVREANGNVDPQGIFYLDKDCRKRNASELSEIFTALARGRISSKDIPAYRFQSPLDYQLEAFLPMMAHWQWREPVTHDAKHVARLQLNRLERKAKRVLVKEAAA